HLGVGAEVLHLMAALGEILLDLLLVAVAGVVGADADLHLFPPGTGAAWRGDSILTGASAGRGLSLRGDRPNCLSRSVISDGPATGSPPRSPPPFASTARLPPIGSCPEATEPGC